MAVLESAAGCLMLVGTEGAETSLYGVFLKGPSGKALFYIKSSPGLGVHDLRVPDSRYVFSREHRHLPDEIGEAINEALATNEGREAVPLMLNYGPGTMHFLESVQRIQA